jgi:NAD(P)-dependent dehydrogenase (short-subunit alcohol dehydrogenase family)
MKDSPVAVIKKLEEKIGEFDVVVHNLGGVPLHIKDALAPVKEWLEVWKLNVGIGIEINNYLIPKMQKRGWGRVVHMSSISGDSLRGRPPYAVAKSTLSSYVTAVGRSVAASGVVVSAIKMGAYTYKGSYWDNAPKEKYDDYIKHHQAIGRLAEVDDVVPSILFLSSNQAKFLTGANIPVDGGTM